MAYTRPSNLVLTVLAAFAAAAVLLLQLVGVPFAPLTAIPLVLFLPGYALTLVLFTRDTLGRVERALLSVALSAAIVILTGFALNLTPWGLTPVTWLVSLVGLTTFIGVLGIMNHRAGVWTTARPVHWRVPLRGVALFALASALLVTALYVARLPSPPSTVQGYSSLWMVPADTSNSNLVSLGFNSDELHTVSYRLDLQVNGNVVRQWDPITLETGQQWQEQITLPAANGKPQTVKALLYRLDHPDEPYRNVLLQRNSPTLTQ